MDESQYLFDNRSNETAGRFDALGSLFDPVTARHLDQLGIGEGWECLEVGAGGGSVTRWMAARVGPCGRVVATDLDVRWLSEQTDAANVEVRQHDVVNEPLPEGAFDLVHERLVLIHLPEREAVLERLVAALRPGGRLLVEDFDATLSADYVDPQTEADELGIRIMQAVRALLTRRGADVELGHKLPRLLREHGLVDVGADSYQGIALGDATRQLHRANITQVRDQLVEQELVTRHDVDHYLELLDRGAVTPSTAVLVSAWGTRPTS